MFFPVADHKQLVLSSSPSACTVKRRSSLSSFPTSRSGSTVRPSPASAALISAVEFTLVQDGYAVYPARYRVLSKVSRIALPFSLQQKPFSAKLLHGKHFIHRQITGSA